MESKLRKDQLLLVSGVFYGTTVSQEFVRDKDVANQIKADFEETSVEEFLEDIHKQIEWMSKDGEATDVEIHQACIGIGVLLKEFIDFKLKGSVKENPTHK